MEIKVMQAVLEANEEVADEVRNKLLQKKILMLNLISSPGSGKTSLLEHLIPQLLKKGHKVAVIEGDVATAKDAERLKNNNIPIILINTNGGCHLDSLNINNALAELNLSEIDIIFVENVGNLVCPAEFDLGEDEKIAIVSTAEGDDKPSKYPMLFTSTKLAILNKIDLLPFTDFNKDSFYKDIKKLNGQIKILEVSCREKVGLEPFLLWIEEKLNLKKSIGA